MPDIFGPFGGIIAAAFGSGCVAGYGFHAKSVLTEYQKVWEKRSETLVSDREEMKGKYERAEQHYQDCEKTLRTLSVRIGRLEGAAGLENDD